MSLSGGVKTARAPASIYHLTATSTHILKRGYGGLNKPIHLTRTEENTEKLGPITTILTRPPAMQPFMTA